MATAQDIIQLALQEIAAYGSNETMSAADATLGLTVLNAMVDQWSNENLMCYARLELSKVLVPGKAAYTIGQSGTPDISAARPLSIDTAYVQDDQGNNFPVDLYEQDRWAWLQNRSLQSQLPTVLYYDDQYPNGIINLYPVPSIAYKLFIDVLSQLNEFSSLTTPLSLPPGYQDAITHNLALRLTPYFGLTPTDLVKELAADSRGTLKRKNLPEVIADFDPELTRGASGGYNFQRFREGR
jgi:hypothetical protein